jgi:hypothetical protein
MDTKILETIKEMLGLPTEDTSFVEELKVHINTALGTAYQIVGFETAPVYLDTGEEIWSQVSSDEPLVTMIKSYCFLKVKTIFDPPQSGQVLASFERSIVELEARLVIQKELLTPIEEGGTDG